MKASHRLNGVSKSLQNISKHRKGLEKIGKVLISVFALTKVVKFGKSIKSIKSIISPAFTVTKRNSQNINCIS